MATLIKINGSRMRIEYATKAEEGSSGSSYFDMDWKVFAIRHAWEMNFETLHEPQYNQVIPAIAILDPLAKRGKTQELGT